LGTPAGQRRVAELQGLQHRCQILAGIQHRVSVTQLRDDLLRLFASSIVWVSSKVSTARGGVDIHTDWIRISNAGQPVSGPTAGV